MEFEETNLPQHEAIRAAFKRAEIEAAVNNMGHLAQAGGRKQRPLELFVRAGKVLHETYPSADPEQIAAAILFLTHGFQEPSLICRAHKDDLPKVCAWAREWSEINNLTKNALPLKSASLELRQIVTAVNIAMIENLRNNASLLDINDMRENLAEKDMIAGEVGEIQPPALVNKLKQARSAIEPFLEQRSIATRLLQRFRRV